MELEHALNEYLRANETSLSKHSRFNPFYTRAESSSSPVKRDSADPGSIAAVIEADFKGVKSRARRVTKAADEIAST